MKRIYRTVFFTLLSLCLLSLFLLPIAAEIIPFQKNEDGYFYSAKEQTGTGVTKAPGVLCRGIDLSYHNKNVDFDELARQYEKGEIGFLILRCGYGQNKTNQDDGSWKTFADACTEKGIPFGTYLYSYATTRQQAINEAEHALRLVQGYRLTYPIYIDIEDAVQKDLTAAQFEAVVDGFCQTVLNAGYETGVVSMYNWFADNDKLGNVDFEGKYYNKWVARYNNVLNKPGQNLTCDLWQCTQTGSVPGVTGVVDIDFSFMEPRTTEHCYVTFQSGVGNVSSLSPLHLTVGDALGSLPTVKRADGTESVGWYTAAIGGVEVTADTVVTEGGQLQLFACWKADVSVTLNRIKVKSGSLSQSVKPGCAIESIRLEPEEGYYLPKTLSDLPDGATWTWINGQEAILGGIAEDSFSLSITAIEKEEQKQPNLQSVSQSPASYEKSDGAIFGLDENIEIESLGVWHRITAEEAKNGIQNLPAGTYRVRFSETDTKKVGQTTEYLLKARAKTPTVEDFFITQPSLQTPFGSVQTSAAGYEISKDGGISYIAIEEKADRLDAWSSVWIRLRESETLAASLPLKIDFLPMNCSTCIDYCGFRIQTNTKKSDFLINGKVLSSDESGWITLTEDMLGTKITVEKKDLQDSPAKCTVTLTVPRRPEAPTVTAIAETYLGQGNGTFAGTNGETEISEDAGSTWHPIEENAIYETGKEYLFRTRASQEQGKFDSQIAKATISEGKPIRVIFRAEGVGDIIAETYYQGTVKIPELPEREGANMRKSAWKTDLTGVRITEDLIVESYYAPEGCTATALSGILFLPIFLAPLLKKEKRKKLQNKQR